MDACIKKKMDERAKNSGYGDWADWQGTIDQERVDDIKWCRTKAELWGVGGTAGVILGIIFTGPPGWVAGLAGGATLVNDVFSYKDCVDEANDKHEIKQQILQLNLDNVTTECEAESTDAYDWVLYPKGDIILCPGNPEGF
jgi:hypothetical protein